jgi:hypothetical protein
MPVRQTVLGRQILCLVCLNSIRYAPRLPVCLRLLFCDTGRNVSLRSQAAFPTA